jgi:hypothetical protein
MQAREFLRRIPAAVRSTLPAELAAFRTSAGFSLSQIWYGNRSLHYEAWIRSRLNVIELGLHFESDPLTNARLLAALQAERKIVQRALGAAARIEPWDKGWARVWEPIALGTLDEDLLNRVASRIASYVSVLEPIVRDALPADVAWNEPKTRRSGPGRSVLARYAAAQRRPSAADRREG